MTHCIPSQNCVPVADNQDCDENEVEYLLNTTETNEFDPCRSATSQDNCVSNIESCIMGAKKDVIFLIKHCNYDAQQRLPPHTQCIGRNNWLRDNGCDHLIIPLSQTIILLLYNSSNRGKCDENMPLVIAKIIVHLYLDCDTTYSEMTCPTLTTPTEMSPETTNPHWSESDATPSGIGSLPTQNTGRATVALVDFTSTLFTSFLAMFVVCRPLRYDHLVIFAMIVLSGKFCLSQGKCFL